MDQKKNRGVLRIILFNLIIVIVFFVLLEAFSFLYYKVRRFQYESNNPKATKEGLMKIFDEINRVENIDKDKFMNEFNDLFENHINFHPYRWYYLNDSFSSNYFKTDKLGYRNDPELWNTTAKSTTAFFGGSTMFGLNNTDEYTIPGKFRQSYTEKDSTRVLNFGIPGYSTTTEINATIELFRYLRPDTCVYYDGVNEVIMHYSHYTYWTDDSIYSKMGFPFFEPVREAIYRSPYKLGAPYSKPLFNLAELNSYKLLSGIAAYFRNKLPKETKAEEPIDPGTEASVSESEAEAIERLSTEICNIYYENIRVIQSLCREYNVTCYFFIQPTLAHKGSAYTERENKIIADQPTLHQLYLSAYQKINADPRKSKYRVMDISDVLADETNPQHENFHDYCHVNGYVNQKVAERIRMCIDTTLRNSR